jgi:hypothetical protein
MKLFITLTFCLFSIVAISQDITLEEMEASEKRLEEEVREQELEKILNDDLYMQEIIQKTKADERAFKDAEINEAANVQAFTDSIEAANSSWSGQFSDGETLLTISYIENSGSFYYKLITTTECWSNKTLGKGYFSGGATATSAFQDSECSLLFTKPSRNIINIEYFNCDDLNNINCPPIGGEFTRK